MEYFFGKMEIAIVYGVDIAIFIENMRYWSETNAKIHENFIDGRYWVYYSLDGFSKMYPIWSRDQVKRLIVKCRDAGLLLTADYNDNPYKRTKWYSLSDSVLEFYGVTVTEDGLWRERHIDMADGANSVGRNRHIDECKTAKCTYGETAKCIEEKGEKKGKKETPKAPKGAPVSEKPKRGRTAKAAPDWKPERFEGFWRIYPVKKSKQAAIRAWDSLHPDDQLLALMGHALQRQLAREDWKRGIGIPYPASWLNGRRWEDEETPARQPPSSGPETERRVIEQEEVPVW